MEQQLENLAHITETENEDDTHLQTLVQFRKHRVNLNTVDASTLKELLINELQIQNLLSYRSMLGSFISVYELQAIPTWDIETIARVLPYVTVNSTVPVISTIKERLIKGNHTLLARMQQVLEKSEGFLRADSILNRYPGSRQRIFLRYKYVYGNSLQYGLTCDKDAGERFFSGSNKPGFDFYSLHFFARRLGPVKSLAVGDYTVNLGQGLIHWQSLAFKKSADVLAVKRQADVLRPYTAAGEYNFHRGAAISLNSGRFDYTGFVSFRKLDGNVQSGAAPESEIISSLATSGYHRTPNELSDRNQVSQTTIGGNLSYNHNSLHLGLNGVSYQFSSPYQRTLQPYNMFAIAGNSWYNYSVDYSYTHRNFHFFGEGALDKNKSPAFIHGALVSLDHRIDASLVYRNIPSAYHALYGNAFTEASLPNNEKGLYVGLAIRPRSNIRIDAYADFFSFPWLRFRVDAPSAGSDYLLQITYKPSKLVEILSRYRYERKATNIYGLDLATRPVVNRLRQNWRTQFVVKSGAFSFRNRVDLVWFHPKVRLSEQGFSSLCDIVFKPHQKRYSMGGRLQYFETDGFESRIYSFESDVLYSFSIPFFSGKGVRYYLSVEYDINKKLSCWLRFAQTAYRDQSSIGTALDEIPGNTKSEIKFQVLYTF